MKILFLSMPSIHALRWIENLKNTDNELYWFDITDKGAVSGFENLTHFVNWKKRKLPFIKGEYRFSKHFPFTYMKVKHLVEVTENEFLERVIKEIQPQVIHSFEMQHCSYPILTTMKKYPNIKWIYSSWGSDLYYYKNFKSHHSMIKEVLKRVNYLHTDCLRDYNLAKNLGFKGKHTGIIPGGSGYHLEELAAYKMPINDRKIILVKGYQHQFGRALNVIKALQNMLPTLANFEVVVFGAHKEVVNYIEEQSLNFTTYHRNELSQNEVMMLMGKSLLYIGNNSSDGMPNTLLEAIIMNAFPIQSNPGNVTAEIIDDGKNGLLISNPDDVKNIEKLITLALGNTKRINEAAQLNTTIALQRLDYNKIQPTIVEIYQRLN